MFKFATNKFNAATSSHSASSNSNQNQHIQKLLSNAANSQNGHHTSDDSQSRRRLIQKDLYSFNKIADKGFPSKPSAIDYDRKLKLLAIGTRNGDIRIYGSGNNHQISSYQDVHPFPILRLLFIQGQSQLITLTERVFRNDMTNKGESQLYLVLWQITNSLVEKVKEYQLEAKVINNSKLSAMTLLNDNSHIFIGFESGDVYVFNVASFQLVPGVINKDFILKNLPEPTTSNGKKLTQLGAVESICHHPRQLTKLLIAYQRGLWCIFDFIKNQIDIINQTTQQLESAVFYQSGECVATSHSDGSFILWDLTDQIDATKKPATATTCSSPNIVYGPYPCKPVSKCMVKTCRNDQPYVIFSGGCPRVNYSDKITITVIQGENSHVCFDFTSKIIDFFTIDKPFIEKTNNQTSATYDNPQALVVLLEEEFVAIDLASEGWPQFRLPYLYSVHSSAIICTHYVNGISKQFYDALKRYGKLDQTEVFSDKEWPLNNAVLTDESHTSSASKQIDLLLTGHEDGSVRFWDVSDTTMTLLYRLRTNDYFLTESTPLDEAADAENEDNWPPFRKVGSFDPYSDDPKLGIQKIYLCAQREILVLAGTAGQVLIMSLSDESLELNEVNAYKINILALSPEVESHFVWKGHDPLATRSSTKIQPGFQMKSLIQLYPPATVSALALNSDWQLVAMGTSHGFVLYDYCQMKDLLIRCTLDPAMLLNQSDSSGNGNTISRRKSLKKSLRESFRKLRRGRSQKTKKVDNKATTQNNAISNQMRVEHIDSDMNGECHKPIERQVESREFKQMDDIPASVIRYMYFVRTFITNNQQQTNSLWVGTNTGIIYIYALQFLNASNQPNDIKSRTLRTNNQVINCLLAKEMRLKHRAPVVHIQVIDQNMQPLPHDVAKANAEITSAFNADQNHKVIICSEEQFKVFQLPTLKPVCKFKLTAVEGARVRRIGYNCYISRQDPNYNEYCLSCLSNLGDLSVYSLPQLKRQVQIQCMKQQDINAITSFVFTKYGQAFYLQSPSEFVQISMSARDTPQLLNIQKTNPATTTNTTPTSNSESASNNKKSTSHSTVVSKENSKKTPPLAQSSSTPITSASTTSPPVPLPRSSINKDESNKSTVESPRSVSGSVSSPSKQLNEDKSKQNGLSSDNVDSHGKNDTKSSTSTKHSNGHLNDLSMKTSSPIKREIDTAHNLNQSTISAINTHNSDSFNANSSGICSITTTSNTTSLSIQNGVDLSLDSVVDRFQEDMHDVSTKKIPSSIEEDNSTSNQNDSVLNISEVSADMNQKLTLNGSTSAKKLANGVSKTNGHHSGNTSASSENGHLENGHLENGHSHSQNGN